MSNTMAEVLADHYVNYQWHRDLSENLWTCTSLDCSFTSRGFEQAIAHQAEVLSAAGFGLVADAKAEALREAAERFKQRSDTYHNTMQEMTASKEYRLEDIVRYGAYSAEANTTATWLRTAATKAAS